MFNNGIQRIFVDFRPLIIEQGLNHLCATVAELGAGDIIHNRFRYGFRNRLPAGNGFKHSRNAGMGNDFDKVGIGKQGRKFQHRCGHFQFLIPRQFARNEGGNFNITSLSQGYKTMLDDTVRKISEFKNTVEGAKFQLAFQPIVDLKNGITHHFEVLVRFEGETSFANPFQFISFGEEAGIIGEFDLAMCQRAIDVLIAARNEGRRPKVAVNLSGKSLSSGIYLDALRKITQQAPGINKQLIFEITESAKISDMDAANDFVQELRQQGFLCCLDDFGVGESSFSYLRSLQVDFVKIDGSYVKESLASKRGQHLLKAMSGMCKELGIVTIGEMVEDEKVAALLWENGVRFGQGYLFGKPTLDTEALLQCQEVNPFYHGILRAKRFSPQKNFN